MNEWLMYEMSEFMASGEGSNRMPDQGSLLARDFRPKTWEAGIFFLPDGARGGKGGARGVLYLQAHFCMIYIAFARLTVDR
jgi:hypothetical protein